MRAPAGFSSNIDSSSQSPLVNNSVTTIGSNINNKVVVLMFDDGFKHEC